MNISLLVIFIKYINNEHSWDIGFPTPIFKNWSSKIDNPQNTNICIPGCGYGHDAIYLAEKGFNVHAIDFSKHATTHIIKKTYKNKNIKASTINSYISLGGNIIDSAEKYNSGSLIGKFTKINRKNFYIISKIRPHIYNFYQIFNVVQ